MANIYLKVPTYLAQWYRGRIAPEPPLTEFQPVVFSPFQDEYVMMESWLTLVSEGDMDHTYCFSERMWKNILAGRSPKGGKAIINRDPKEWPTMGEINVLTGQKRNKKTDGFDYLCIAAPRTILVGRQFKQVTGSFTLQFSQANELVRQLRRDFLHVLLHWVCEELFYCNKKGVRRSVTMCIDHLFYYYQMCLGTNSKDRDSMRRMAKRWLEEAKMLSVEIDGEDALMTYEKEMERRGINIDEMIRDVNSVLNKT